MTITLTEMRRLTASFGTKSDDAYADAAGYLCQHETEVRQLIGEQRWTAAVPVITSAEPSSTAWRDAIRAVHDAMEAEGIQGGLGLRFTMGDGFPAPPPPRSSGWVCPRGCCSRVVLRDAAATPDPLCALTGRPMRMVE
jgi:hypothetical protein